MTAAPSSEPIYADPYTRIAWLHARLQAVADAWFEFRQSDLDALLHDYRMDDDAT